MSKPVPILIAAATTVVLAIVAAITALALQRDANDPAQSTGRDYSGVPMMSDQWRDDPWREPMRNWMSQSVPASEADYLTDMVAHHTEAVITARELTRSDRDQMRDLGASIVKTQTAQIDQMNEWLGQWHPAADPSAYQPMMRDLKELDGDQLDRAFLDDMIGHHMMAVMMSQHFLAADLADHTEVATLAETIRNEQHSEIVTMMHWYRDWFGSRWPGGLMSTMNGWGATDSGR